MLNFVKTRINDEVQFCIPPITKEIIDADLKKIPSNKATGLDGISIRMLKEALQAISPSLAHIYGNTSISQDVFPATFKEAKVTPLQKKDSRNERGNYRPISVLPILFNPLERHVAPAYLLRINLLTAPTIFVKLCTTEHLRKMAKGYRQ